MGLQHKVGLPRNREDWSALGYLAGWKCLRWLPAPLARALFNAIADYACDYGRGMEQLRRNLMRVVGPENVTRQLVRDSMRSYMRYWLEAFRLPDMHQDPQLQQQLVDSIEGKHYLDESIKAGRGVILALPHSGNWDMAGVCLVSLQGQFTTVAERVRPEVLFQAFVDFRTKLGFDVIPLSGGEVSPFARLKEVVEQGGFAVLLAERDLSGSGIEVEFFEDTASVASGPARLAYETGAPLHVVHTWFKPDDTDGTQRWGLSVSAPLKAGDVQGYAQQMADGFAENIAKHPADWHMLQPLFNADIRRRRKGQ